MADEEEKIQISEKLLSAINKNNMPKVIKLLNEGADVHYFEEYALSYSSWRGYYDMAELLLDHGANINYQTGDGTTSLIIACKVDFDNTSIIELLLKNGADPNLGDTDSTIIFCCQNDRADILKLLCEYGFEFDFDKEYVWNQSIALKNINIIEFLLEKYPDYFNNVLCSTKKYDKQIYQFIKMLVDRELIDIPN